MDLGQLALRFLLGGVMVVAVTLVAAWTRNAYVAGITASFPTVLLAGAIALRLAGYPPAFISRYFLGTLAGITIVLVFSLSAAFLIKRWGVALGLSGAIGVWLVSASVVAAYVFSRR